MGRLPKGFKKTLQHKEEDAPAQPAVPPMAGGPSKAKVEGKDKDDQPSSSFLKAAPKPAAAAAPPAPATASVSAKDEDEDEEDGDGPSTSGPESRGQMIRRHKKEMQAFKKNLPRLGKKSKEEIAKLTADLEAKQAKELAALPETDAATEEQASTPAGPVQAVQAAVGALHVGGDEEGAEGGSKGHMTKAMKRRQKLAQSEAEREARIAAEAAAAGPSARVVEEEALDALLQPLGLKMRDIRADGHCLYRSLEDQLTLVGGKGVTEYQQLREAAAAHMRQHPDQYTAFMDVEDNETPAEALERHCKELESTAAWGGQLELSVLAQVLRRPIHVYTVGMSPITLGEEYAGDERTPLQVCYLRHAFGLGEHYNSLEAATTA